jgi:group I intron endonuclease
MKGIYKITNPKGAVYIGQSIDINYRWNRHRKGDTETKVGRSVLKYGHENHKFEIAAELPEDISQQVLDTYEIFYIDQYKECGFEMLNVAPGGQYKRISKHTPETKAKISEKQTGKKHPVNEAARLALIERNKSNTGSKRSEETKTKMSLVRKGSKLPEAWKLNIGKGKLGNKNGLGNKGNKNGFTGKHSAETIAKMKGRPAHNKGVKYGPVSEERRKNIIEGIKKSKDKKLQLPN